GSGHGAAEKVLAQLIENRRPAVAYLERSGQGISEQPEPEAARLLVEAIKPQEAEPPYVRALREVVFRWVWQASQRGD
ncbi:MAG: hypothetical protein GY856_43640, partial [bacterium]|nr:hypothetical protein [bacterium]